MVAQQSNRGHELCLNNCQEGQISGVREVLSFGAGIARVGNDDTVCGNLTFNGCDLHCGVLWRETGSVQLTGQVTSIQYSKSKKAADAGRHLLQKMFQ